MQTKANRKESEIFKIIFKWFISQKSKRETLANRGESEIFKIIFKWFISQKSKSKTLANRKEEKVKTENYNHDSLHITQKCKLRQTEMKWRWNIQRNRYHDSICLANWWCSGRGKDLPGPGRPKSPLLWSTLWWWPVSAPVGSDVEVRETLDLFITSINIQSYIKKTLIHNHT